MKQVPKNHWWMGWEFGWRKLGMAENLGWSGFLFKG
jgi:hypothetical protein